MRFTPSFRKVYCNGVAQSCNSRLWLTLTPTITNKWNSAECKDIPVLVPANLSSFEATFHSPLESRSLAAFSRSSLPRAYPVCYHPRERRAFQESFDSPSPPPLGDPRGRNRSTFRERRRALPPKSTIRSGASPRLKPGGGLSPIALDRGIAIRGSQKESSHEMLSHQGHSKRWHCRSRRHRKDATGVVVAVCRGHDAAVGKSCGWQRHNRLGRRGGGAKDIDSGGPRLRRVARDADRPLRLVRQS